MKTQALAIMLAIFCTIFTSMGQFLFKLGASKLTYSIIGLLMNWQIILGFLFYGVGALLLILALKRGELSVIYPFIALSFIWVALLSVLVLGETMTLANWFGIIIIIGGVTLIGVGAQAREHHE